MINSENTNNDTPKYKSERIQFRLIYVWASIFLFIIVVKMAFYVRNMNNINHRLLNYVIKHNNLDPSYADIYVDKTRKVYFSFEDCNSNYQNIIDSFTEYMEMNPDIYYDVPQIIYVRFSHKINHNHSETFLYFTNIKKGEILKNFEVGSLGKYCDRYISFTNTKITCLKTLTFDTIDLGSQPETVLKAFDGIEEFYITGRLNERNKFTEIINNQFPGSKIFYTELDEGR